MSSVVAVNTVSAVVTVMILPFTETTAEFAVLTFALLLEPIVSPAAVMQKFVAP
jgi:hypothetical protein